MTGQSLKIYIGYDSREAVATEVAAHSIKKRTNASLDITYLKHRDLRTQGQFARPWLIEGHTGEFIDLIDGRKFSTEFSHTRFLVPSLMDYKGWALFMDGDMIFLSDIEKLFALCDDKYAIMVVKHNHIPHETVKMDGREQLRYRRKNWSSFILWNCGHPSNAILTADKVNFMKGTNLHGFSWLDDSLIGGLPFTYNFISGVSPSIGHGKMANVIHYTNGGPWFEECKDVPYAGTWIEEYEDFQTNGHHISEVPSMAYDVVERLKK